MWVRADVLALYESSIMRDGGFDLRNFRAEMKCNVEAALALADFHYAGGCRRRVSWVSIAPSRPARSWIEPA